MPVRHTIALGIVIFLVSSAGDVLRTNLSETQYNRGTCSGPIVQAQARGARRSMGCQSLYQTIYGVGI